MLYFQDCPSPNFNKRPSSRNPELIIIHYTGMQPAGDALSKLCNPDAAVSAHYLIEKNGSIYRLVEDKNRAWHAGLSYWQGERDINGISLGIELDNGGHDFALPSYPAKQIEALLSLLSELSQKYHISPERIIGHSDIAPSRKIDPGEHFPWEILHKYGFGLWPGDLPVRDEPQSIPQVQEILEEIGYDCPQTNILDPLTVAVIQAFQRHFTPAEITGTITQKLKYILSCFNT